MHSGSFPCSCLVFPLKAGFLIISFIEEIVFLARKCGRVLGGVLEGWDVVCRFKTSDLQQIEQFVQVVPQTSPPTKARK